MFDVSHLQDTLTKYKQDFATQWGNEQYKWEAVKHFQDNWDVNASDFADMLKCSLSQTFNLLASKNNFPAAMIEELAEAAPEEVRAMYIALFDESVEVVTRILAFKDQSSVLLEKYKNGAVQHYQYENAISTYLWLCYPDKYYIYKYGEAKKVAEILGSDYQFKKGAYSDNLRNFYSLYNEICAEIQKDEGLISLFKSKLTDNCYTDPEYRTLAIDVGFYISRYSASNGPGEPNDWYPLDYSPEISVDEWVQLLGDPEVFTSSSLEIMKRIKDYGGQATCTQLSIKYGETKNFYNKGSSALAQRVATKTKCSLMEKSEENSQWWPILYLGRSAEKDDSGSYTWKLRDELSAALDKIDLSGISLYPSSAPGEVDIGYWWLNANPRIWSFTDIAVGDVQSYTLYNDNGNKRRIFQNFLAAKAGDIVVGYESSPVKQVVALCKISAEHDNEKIYFEKVEGLISPIDYLTLKNCPALERMEYFINPQGSLFKLTKGEYDFIIDIIREENPIATETKLAKYSKADFLDLVYMDESRYDTLVAVLQNKKNIILQGAPGVGKTFAANRLAYSIMGEIDESRIEFVQFHQNYSYEDFMLGFKPADSGFELRTGIFYRFCQKSRTSTTQCCFMLFCT